MLFLGAVPALKLWAVACCLLKTMSVDLLQFRLKLLRSAHRYTLSSSSSLYAMLLPGIMTYVFSQYLHNEFRGTAASKFFTWFFTWCGLNCDKTTCEARRGSIKTHPRFSCFLRSPAVTTYEAGSMAEPWMMFAVTSIPLLHTDVSVRACTSGGHF